ncbi:cysteine proteinase [Polyporus arcularius HHB13444]|uniref:Ubiquitin carboxyl-terminal hydrolase n=1 Tax=Polyporus arcularius HHB13444 TaxID=1314778 RepID=A0A5C3PES5_9APHY|nr:cysteine proteinase [Polyporus arcularius HHB13444]
MAIGKWISFGTSQAAATPVPAVVEQAPIVSAADAKLFGLENFGNTCYANSVLQALYFCGPFRELLLQYPDPSVPEFPQVPPPPPASVPQTPQPPSRKKPTRQNSISEPPPKPNAPPAIPIPPSPPTLLSALRSLFLHISKNPADKGTVAPRAFIDKLKELNELFRSSMHQDAHEFLNYLLNRVMEDMEEDGRRHGSAGNGTKSVEDLSNSIATLSTQPAASTSTAQAMAYHSTIVHRLFEGVLTSETRCLTCETVSSRDESFIDLSIDIEQNSSVTACLRQFSASEMLCQKNKFFCDSCCDLQEAEKRMKIKKLPNILALHLKRFKYQEDVGKYIKLAYRVAFPLELRLFNTVDDAEDPDRLYELFAIVVHIGTGPHHGHYVTIIKARGAWLLFDDDTVTTMKESEIPKYFGESNSGSAYVLYYQAVDLDLSALGLKPPTPPPAATVSTDIGSVPGKTVSLATAEGNEVPSSPAPAVPPGLVDDIDYSDKSDSPAPLAPTVSSDISPLNTPRPPSVPSPPNISVQIPSPSSPPLPSSPSQPHHNHTLGGFLHTIRTTPSLRLRNGGSSNVDRRSGADVAGSLPSPSISRRPHTIPSSPVPSKGYAFPNGNTTPTKEKERGPERKPSAWFRIKSSRRRGSEAAISDMSSPVGSPVIPTVTMPPLASGSATEPPLSPAAHKKSAPELSRTVKRDKRRSDQSKLPPRPSTAGATMSSSSSSSLRGLGSRPSSGIAMPPPLPPLPGSPISPEGGANGSAQALYVKGKTRENDEADRPRDVPAPRELPSPPTQAQSPRERRQSTPAPPRPRSSQLGHGHADNYPFVPTPQGVVGSGSVADTPVPPSHSSSSSSSAGANWKRATRKLSFTAPKFGIGKKDKRDKDGPPSSFGR